MIKSKNDPDYIFEQYSGYIIASHKKNVAEKNINNLIIVYHLDEFPNSGYIIGLDDSKLSGRRESFPNNLEDAKSYIDWTVKCCQEKAVKRNPKMPKSQKSKGRKK